MSELKPVLGDDGEPDGVPKPEVSTLTSMEALNRRDIELIKKSLVTMHKDGAELRNAILALHACHHRVPSRGFFVGLGLVGFLAVAVLAVARPTLAAALQRVPALARLAPVEAPR